jgi:hypothetical protein
MTPDDVAYPITALPFSIRVGDFVGELFVVGGGLHSGD